MFRDQPSTRALAVVMAIVALIGWIEGCDSNRPIAPAALQGGGPSYVLADSSLGDTIPCGFDSMDNPHCPLTQPDSAQMLAITGGIDDIYSSCGWMQTFLIEMWIHGSINMYSGFPLGAVADMHRTATNLDNANDRLHLNSTDNYAYIHWVIRHEAAHALNSSFTEAQADSVGNACGPDSKPYN